MIQPHRNFRHFKSHVRLTQTKEEIRSSCFNPVLILILKMEKSKRTEFTAEQVRMLEEAYGQGTRKGKAWLGARQKLAEKLNLTELQVKNWLGNYNKSKSGRGKVVERKTLPAVRPTAYSLFCKEYSKDHPGFNPSIWKIEWEAVGEKEKERYAKMAREMAEEGGSGEDDPTSQKRTIRTLLKQLEWTSRRLENMGLPNFALVAENNTVHSVGTGRGREFLDHEDLEPNFSRFCNQDYSTQEKSNVNELRKTVQVHMNELYRKASDKAGCFPYKMVRKGDIVVEGLPQAVLPLHPPSHYGEEKLQLLLSCPSISIRYPQSAEPTESLSQEPSTSSARSSSLEPLPSSSSPSKAPSVNVSGYSSAKCPDSTSHRKVTVYWKKIPKRFQNGRLKNYTIFNGDVNVQVSPDSSFGEVEIPCKSSSIVTVKGCNDEGCSPESSITIPQIKEVILPTRVIVEHFNESTVKVSWFHTDGQAAVDIIWCNGRSGTLQCLGEIELQRINGSDKHTFLSASDVNSKIDEVYFGVAIINDRQLSGGIKWQEACRYQMSREPVKILGVKLLPDAPENSLVISWSPALCDASDISNVYVHSYQIIFCRLDSKKQCIGEESSIEVPAADNTQYTLRNLHSEVYYGLWVRARSLRENGPRSDMVSGIPINNDLSTSAITGIVVSGVFVFILVMAGGVFIFRNVRRKLGLDETFPIHLPNLEFKTRETNLSTHDNGIKSPFSFSSDSKELSGLPQSAERVNVLFTTQETLIKYLKENPTNKPINANYDIPLAPTDDVPNEINRRKGIDEESVSRRLSNSTPASPILNLKEKQKTSKAEAREILPPDYAKATTIALTCLNDIESSPLKEEIGTYISPLNSSGNTPEPAFSGDYNEKQNDVNAQTWKKDYTEENSTTSARYNRDNLSFNNDESYVTNDSRYWKTGNEIEQCQKDVCTTAVKQSMDSSMSEEMSENLMDSIKNTILDSANINANVSFLDKDSSTSNQMDYVGSDFFPPDDVHNDSNCTSYLHSTPKTVGDLHGSKKELTNEFKQSVDMWADYVPNDSKAVLDPDPGDTLDKTV